MAAEPMDDDADVADANAFESPVQHCPVSSPQTVYPEMDPPDGEPSSAPPPEHNDAGHLTIQSGTGNCEAASVFVLRFPYGRPGARLDGTRQGATVYESTWDTLGDSVWAPFRSQCDWEIALWAKERGPSSSAMTELLAIPEVCVTTPLVLLSD
jgi:hypothetical protein